MTAQLEAPRTAATVLMTAEEARACVEQINDRNQDPSAPMGALYVRRGWKALGYQNFRTFVDEELPFSRSQAYRLVKRGLIDENEKAQAIKAMGFGLPGRFPEGDWIYFIQAGEDGPIKIGYSRDPVKRLEVLQTGSAVKLKPLAVAIGDMDVERALHAALAEERVQGEWFSPSPRLLAFIRDHTSRWEVSLTVNDMISAIFAEVL